MFQQLDFWELLAPPSLDDDLDVILSGFTKEQLKYFHGPIIQYRSGSWEFPSRLRKLVPQARIEQALHGEDGYASELEALGYISTASLEFPLSHEWANVTFWLCDRVLQKFGLLPDDEGSVADILGRETIQISRYETSEYLLPLRRWLRKNIVKNAKLSMSK